MKTALASSLVLLGTVLTACAGSADSTESSESASKAQPFLAFAGTNASGDVVAVGLTRGRFSDTYSLNTGKVSAGTKDVALKQTDFKGPVTLPSGTPIVTKDAAYFPAKCGASGETACVAKANLDGTKLAAAMDLPSSALTRGKPAGVQDLAVDDEGNLYTTVQNYESPTTEPRIYILFQSKAGTRRIDASAGCRILTDGQGVHRSYSLRVIGGNLYYPERCDGQDQLMKVSVAPSAGTPVSEKVLGGVRDLRAWAIVDGTVFVPEYISTKESAIAAFKDGLQVGRQVSPFHMAERFFVDGTKLYALASGSPGATKIYVTDTALASAPVAVKSSFDPLYVAPTDIAVVNGKVTAVGIDGASVLKEEL